MAKVSGLTTGVSVGGQDISTDVTALTVDTPYGVQDVTGIDKSAMERILLRADCSGTISGVFDTAANKAHVQLKTPGSKAMVFTFPGATLTFTAVTSNYAVALGADGALTWSVNYALASGTAAAWS